MFEPALTGQAGFKKCRSRGEDVEPWMLPLRRHKRLPPHQHPLLPISIHPPDSESQLPEFRLDFLGFKKAHAMRFLATAKAPVGSSKEDHAAGEQPLCGKF